MIKTYFLLILCVLFWSGNFILGRFIKDDITPLEMAFFRWLFVFIIISPILILRYKSIYHNIKNHLIVIFCLAILGITGFNTILYVGLSMTTATNALIINSSIPILVLLLSSIILKQHLHLYQTMGIIVSTLGVIYLILQGNVNKIFSLQFNQGDIWIIVSSFTWALYSIILRYKPKTLNDIDFFATIVFIGFICLLPIYLYQGYSLDDEIEVLKSNYLIFGYVSIFASSLSYYFWHHGIKHIGASKTAQFAHLMPLFGAILAYIFLNETLHFYHIIGMLLIAIGIYVSLFIKAKVA